MRLSASTEPVASTLRASHPSLFAVVTFLGECAGGEMRAKNFTRLETIHMKAEPGEYCIIETLQVPQGKRRYQLEAFFLPELPAKDKN